LAEKVNIRYQSVAVVFLLASTLLLIRSLHLQAFDKSVQEQAKKATFNQKTLYPSRGLIYDRNDKLLVFNKPIYDLNVIYNRLDPNMDTTMFCSLLNIDKENFIQSIEKDWKSKLYSKRLPYNFKSKIPSSQFLTFLEHLHKFPGFYPQLRNVRGYNTDHAAHILGYISEVNQKQIDANEDSYSLGDYIGASGFESQYEAELKGEKGIEYYFKDNLGREAGKYEDGKGDFSAKSGSDVQVSIDIELQEFGETLMQNKIGSIVAIDPKTGEILSMVSSPSFSPKKLSISEDRGKDFEMLRQDSLKPFFDRSVMAQYPPGSIFKTVLSLVAMQEKVLNPNQTIYCDGYYQYRSFTYDCHEHSTPYNVSIALQHSCNTYFFQSFRDLIELKGFNQPEEGLKILTDHLYDFGLGKALNSDNPNEKNGLVPTSDFYERLYEGKGDWRSTYILSLGIGQGEFLFTTIQMANLAAIIANKGKYYTPHLIKKYLDFDKEIPENFRTVRSVRIEEQYFDPVIKGMEAAVRQGTGLSAYIPDIPICGKTGTSQNPHGEDHSVFFAFAPKDDPKIAIAVYVENGGFGATFASPIASLMIEKYLRGEISPGRKYWENRILNADLTNIP